MKKLVYYAGILIIVIIVIPLIIVKGYYKPHGNTIDNNQQGEVTKITIYNASLKKNQEMDFEEYIKGVVAAEMPADFDIEALKAQAVAARTFAFGRLAGAYKSKEGVHDGVAICTDSTHCQAWISKEKAMKNWGIFFAGSKWRKIEKAVLETSGVIVTYKDQIANTLFHSNSGGKTENSEDVWAGVSVPYLRSISSMGEDDCKDYKAITKIKISDFINKLTQNYPEIKLNKSNILSNISVLGYTAGDRVKIIKIGNITMKGTELRTLFSLRSTNFKIEKADNENLKITTFGFGHGVGMSQWGANYLAKRGGTYDEILKYYYTGVELMTIEAFKAGHS